MKKLIFCIIIICFVFFTACENEEVKEENIVQIKYLLFAISHESCDQGQMIAYPYFWGIDEKTGKIHALHADCIVSEGEEYSLQNISSDGAIGIFGIADHATYFTLPHTAGFYEKINSGGRLLKGEFDEIKDDRLKRKGITEGSFICDEVKEIKNDNTIVKVKFIEAIYPDFSKIIYWDNTQIWLRDLTSNAEQELQFVLPDHPDYMQNVILSKEGNMLAYLTYGYDEGWDYYREYERGYPIYWQYDESGEKTVHVYDIEKRKKLATFVIGAQSIVLTGYSDGIIYFEMDGEAYTMHEDGTKIEKDEEQSIVNASPDGKYYYQFMPCTNPNMFYDSPDIVPEGAHEQDGLIRVINKDTGEVIERTILDGVCGVERPSDDVPGYYEKIQSWVVLEEPIDIDLEKYEIRDSNW